MASSANVQGRGPKGNGTRLSTAKRSKKRWRLVFVLAMSALVVWLLPPIVANTPLLPWILQAASSDLRGSARVERASLDWFSPIEVKGIEVKDREGNVVVSVASIRGSRSLAAIALDYTNLGTFHIQGLKMAVVLRARGSNVEDVLANYLKPAGKPGPAKTSTAISVGVELSDACLSVADELTGRQWQVDNIAARFQMDRGGVMQGAVTAELADEGRLAKLQAEMKSSAAAGEAAVNVSRLPLAVFRPLVARFLPGARTAGRLSSEIRASWGGADGKNVVEANLSTEGFAVSSPELLQTDVVQLERLQAVGRASWNAKCVEIEQSSLDCDLGNVTLKGTIPLDGADGFSTASLMRRPFDLSGRLDLARLARLLPATLHIRRNMRIDSGSARLAFASRAGERGAVWHGQLDVADLSGTLDERVIAWRNPLSSVLDAHDTPAGAIVDLLRCQSDFLKLEAAGTPDDLTATLSFSLQQLAERLGQFVDFGQAQFAGEGAGKLRWRRSADQLFDASADLQVSGFQWSLPGQPPWREESVVARLSAQGMTDFDETTRIDAATLAILAGMDRIDAKLARPVTDLRQGGVWPVSLRATGQLQPWPARLAAWLPTGGWQAAGNYQVDAEGDFSTARTLVRRADFTASPRITAPAWQLGGQLRGVATMEQSAAGVRFATDAEVNGLMVADRTGQQFQEPRIQLSIGGVYDPATQAIQIEKCTFRSTALALGAIGRIGQADGQTDAQIDAQMNYDLGRLCDLLRPCIGPGIRLVGRGSSKAWYRGPFDLKTATAAGDVRWDAGRVHGFPLGPGQLKAAMGAGAVRIEPVDLLVNQGRVHLAPMIHLTSNPMELSLPKGPLAQRIQLDPTMCTSMLKYAAPALADVLEVHGMLSVDLNTCRIPLNNPRQSNISGRLIAHNVQVSRGPMIDELSVLLGGQSAARLRQECVVPFRMQNGRVYHEGLDIEFPEMTIRTQGWVGLDESLDITADMGIPAEVARRCAGAFRGHAEPKDSPADQGHASQSPPRPRRDGPVEPTIHPSGGRQCARRRAGPVVRTKKIIR